jgi:hypothetical protein
MTEANSSMEQSEATGRTSNLGPFMITSRDMRYNPNTGQSDAAGPPICDLMHVSKSSTNSF